MKTSISPFRQWGVWLRHKLRLCVFCGRPANVYAPKSYYCDGYHTPEYRHFYHARCLRRVACNPEAHSSLDVDKAIWIGDYRKLNGQRTPADDERMMAERAAARKAAKDRRAASVCASLTGREDESEEREAE